MSSIDIQTTQNVTIEYELASLRERAIAFFIDSIIVLVAYTAFLILVAFAIRSSSWENRMVWYMLYGLMPILGITLYHFFSEILADGQSWGKKALGLKVVRLDGRRTKLD